MYCVDRLLTFRSSGYSNTMARIMGSPSAQVSQAVLYRYGVMRYLSLLIFRKASWASRE